MKQSDLISIYETSTKTKEFFDKIKNTKTLNINGLSGSLKSLYISSVLKKNKSNHFFVFQKKEDSLIFLNDLKSLGLLNIFFFF